MNLGLALPNYANDGWRIPSAQFIDLAQRAETAGFGGLWVTEHLLRPPGRPYSRLNPLTSLSVVAGATDRIPLGTCIMIQPLRNPVLLAERIATLQHLADARLNLGLGIGWAPNEYAAVNVPFEERGPRFTEGLEIMTRLFAGETVTFDGDFYQIEDVVLDPPVSQPPNIYIGGGSVETDSGRVVPEPIKHRILEYGDGWLASSRSPSALDSDWEEITSYVEAHGRDPATLEKIALNWLHLVPGVEADTAREKQRYLYEEKDGSDRDVMSRYLSGSVSDVTDQLAEYEWAGFDELIIGPVVHEPTQVESQFNYYIDHLGDFL